MLIYVSLAILVLLLLAVIVAGAKTLREAREAAERLNTFAERVRGSDGPWTD